MVLKSQDEVSASNEVRIEGIQLFFDSLVVVARRWQIVAGITAVLVVGTAIASFIIPKSYTASARIMSPEKSTSGMGLLAQQLGSFSSIADSELLKNPNDMYIAMMRTRIVQDSLIKKYDLQKVYKQKLLTKTRDKLDSFTSIETGKDNLITISVMDRDPQRAAAMANSYVDELNRVTTSLAESDAAIKKQFFRKQLDITEADLMAAEQELKNVEQKTGVLHLDTQAKVMIEAVAAAKGELASKEIALESLRATETPNHPDIIRLQREISAQRAQLASLEGRAGSNDSAGSTRTFATAGLEYARRYREVRFQETLLELLSKQYEAARMDESRNSVSIQMLDPAVPPEIPTAPRRVYMILAALILGLAFSVAGIFVYEASVRLLQNPEIGARIALIRQYISRDPIQS